MIYHLLLATLFTLCGMIDTVSSFLYSPYFFPFDLLPALSFLPHLSPNVIKLQKLRKFDALYLNPHFLHCSVYVQWLGDRPSVLESYRMNTWKVDDMNALLLRKRHRCETWMYCVKICNQVLWPTHNSWWMFSEGAVSSLVRSCTNLRYQATI